MSDHDPRLLRMTLRAFRYCRGFLAVVAFSAEPARVHGVHRHPVAAFFHPEDLIMAVFAAECIRMEFVAERDRSDVLWFIHQVFRPARTLAGGADLSRFLFRFIFLYSAVAAGALSIGSKSRSPVMAGAAIFSFIERAHIEIRTLLRGQGLHLKELRVAPVATEPPFFHMKLMTEQHGFERFCIINLPAATVRKHLSRKHHRYH